MSRRYYVSEPGFAATAASDLIQIKNASGSNKMVRIIRWGWKPTDNSLATAQVLQTRCRRLPSTVTDGSGGATPTPRPMDGGDTAATFTALSRNTVKATTNGTAAILDESGAHIYNGYEQQPEEPIIIAPAQSFVFELTSASVQGTVNISAFVEVDEEG
jgi:hypothetical protein